MSHDNTTPGGLSVLGSIDGLLPTSPKPSSRVHALTIAFSDHGQRDHQRVLASEVPVQVSFADIPFGIMMMTPADLDDFAYGFSLTEGVIEAPQEIRAVSVAEAAGGFTLKIDLVAARLHAHLARKRAMAGRTSCGLCGIEDFEALPRARVPDGGAPPLALAAVQRALGQFDARQTLNAATHAVHGAAWVHPDGQIALVREDVGRHNALDKLVGACLRSGMAPRDGFIVVTSRASYEMVEKAATFGCRSLVAISAPTALAVDRAKTLDVTLVGIARRDAVTVFHGVERVSFDEVVP